MASTLAPNYSVNTAYKTGQYITWQGNSTYIAINDSPIGMNPVNLPNSWQKVFIAVPSAFITSVSSPQVITLAVAAGNLTATLNNTTVTAGSYTATNLTVDAQGRITAASNGGSGGTVTSIATAGLISGGTITTTGTITTSMNTGKLVGRGTAGVGVMEEITISTGLTLTGTTLTASGSGGTVTSFSAGNLSPVFTTSVATATTTPALSFSLSNAAANTYFGNPTGGAASPAYTTGGNLTEATSSVLTITGGTASVLTSGTTIQVKLAGAAQSGYLSSTDWNTFNNKQPAGSYVTAIGVTTANGVSGTSSGGTTPNLTIALGAITPTSVNGVTFSGSGSLNNSGASSLNAFTGSGTSSGTNTGDITLTTTGSSGVATLTGQALNIPNYSISGLSPLTTKGDLFSFSTVNTRLAVGATNGMFLQVSSGATTGLAWSGYTLPTSVGASGTILRSNGTNYVATTSTFADTYTASNLLYSNGANAVAGLATANSSVLVTDGSGVPSLSTTLPNGITATTQSSNDNSTKVATTAYVDATHYYTPTVFTINTNFAASTTYYFGLKLVGSSIGVTTNANTRTAPLPYNGTLIGATICSANITTNASAGNVTLIIRINNTTDVTLTSTYSMATTNSLSVTGLTQAITAGDTWEVKMITPAWLTPPVGSVVTIIPIFK